MTIFWLSYSKKREENKFLRAQTASSYWEAGNKKHLHAESCKSTSSVDIINNTSYPGL